jgi:hypothetical protein
MKPSEADLPEDRRSTGAPAVPFYVRLVEVPLGGALVLLVPGLIAVWTHSVLLFPSLGPTALMQVSAPEHASSRFYNTVVGHGGGVAAAYFAVWLFGLGSTPSVFLLREVSAARLAATLVAITLAAALEVLLDSSHPPAASSTLLISLGTLRPTTHDVLTIVIGVLATAVTGELLRRARLLLHG